MYLEIYKDQTLTFKEKHISSINKLIFKSNTYWQKNICDSWWEKKNQKWNVGNPNSKNRSLLAQY